MSPCQLKTRNDVAAARRGEAAIASDCIALDLSPASIKAAFEEGFRCNQIDDVRPGGILFGMLRISFGAVGLCRMSKSLRHSSSSM
jgi:hypothetical protein